MTIQKGFVSISVIVLLNALLIVTLYTGYTIYLQSCLRAHQMRMQHNNDIIIAAELYTRHFAYENWKKLEGSDSYQSIVIQDLFHPENPEYILILKNWKFSHERAEIEYRVENLKKLVGERKLILRRNDTSLIAWRSEKI